VPKPHVVVAHRRAALEIGLRDLQVESTATTIEEVVEEVLQVKLSERATRLIDGDNEDSMEKKKTEGYF
jgi:hypothetical protein